MPLFNFKIKESGKDWDEISSSDWYADNYNHAREIAISTSQARRAEVRYNEAGSFQGHYVRAYDEQETQQLLSK